MVNWYLDEGLAQLRREWLVRHPEAVVYTIGDASHLSRDSEHNPEPAGKAPGASAGEVDATDFMIGHGVTRADLQELHDGLVRSRDPRILYVIWDRHITSSTVQPWVQRAYSGSDPHTDHVHVSANDAYKNNASDWKWEPMARTVKFIDVHGKLPILKLGDDDGILPGWNHIGRAQAIANWLDKSSPSIDEDGVYGPKTAAKFGKVAGTGKGVNTFDEALWRRLFGLSA